MARFENIISFVPPEGHVIVSPSGRLGDELVLDVTGAELSDSNDLSGSVELAAGDYKIGCPSYIHGPDGSEHWWTERVDLLGHASVTVLPVNS